MSVRPRMRRRRPFAGLALCLLAAGAFEGATRAAAPAEPTYTPVLTVSYGQELYQRKARCGSCHGWAGDGEGQPHSAGDAANLRKTHLSRDQLIETIACGRPGTAMPHFDAYAYSYDKCYGLTEAEIGANPPADSPRPLQRREIEAIVNYLETKVIGRGPPTRAECADVYGDSPPCEAYPR